jgi:hypothetical protein
MVDLDSVQYLQVIYAQNANCLAILISYIYLHPFLQKFVMNSLMLVISFKLASEHFQFFPNSEN